MARHILVLNWQDITHPLGGGAEVHLHEIFKRIVGFGHEVTFLSCHYPGAKTEEHIDGIHIIRHGSRAFYNYHVPFIYNRLKHNYSFDIVVDAINKIPLFTPLFIRKIPTLTIVHHLFRKSIFTEAALPAALYVYSMESLVGLIYRKKHFCVISESTRKDIKALRISDNQISLIDICVDHDLYKPALPAKTPYPLISYLGRIKRYKSVDHVLHAFVKIKNELPEAQLAILGDGDDLSRLKTIAHDLNLQDITFLGFIEPEEKVKYLQKSHIVVNPSSKEGWGLTVIEANACGTPVVASDVPGLRDSVVDGKTGFLYPYGDVQALAEKTIQILQDGSLRRKMEENALKWAARFNWDVSAQKTLDLIEKIISSHTEVSKVTSF